MNNITTSFIREVLAGNLSDFAALARSNRHTPREILVEPLKNWCGRCIAQANFAYQILAIDADEYTFIRDIVNDLTCDLLRLRRVYRATNYICGQDGAIKAAANDVGERIGWLSVACTSLRDATQTVQAPSTSC